VLGIAFDPNYVVNRYVYVFVTVSASEQRIVRFTDVNNLGAARTNIVTGLPTLGANHDGGALAFGHDGKLYWAVGDNGAKAGRRWRSHEPRRESRPGESRRQRAVR
jgi:glucose/arabinose dehydrogenase